MAMVSAADLRKPPPKASRETSLVTLNTAPTPPLSANAPNSPPQGPRKRSAQQIMRAHYRQQMLPPRTWQQAEAQRQKLEEMSAERNQGSRATYLAAASLADSHARKKNAPQGPTASPRLLRNPNLGAKPPANSNVRPQMGANRTSVGSGPSAAQAGASSATHANLPQTSPTRSEPVKFWSSKTANPAEDAVDPHTPQKPVRPAPRPHLEHRNSSFSSIGTTAAIAAAKHSRRSSEVSLDSRRSSVSSCDQLPSPQRTSLSADYTLRNRGRSRSRSSSVSLAGSDSAPSPSAATSRTGRINASAAARASALNPIQVPARVPLSAKFVSTLSQALRREQEQRSADKPVTSQQEEDTKRHKHELRLLKTLRSKPATDTKAARESPPIVTSPPEPPLPEVPLPEVPHAQDARSRPSILESSKPGLAPRMSLLRADARPGDRGSVHSANTVISVPSRRSVDSVRSANSMNTVDSAGSDRRASKLVASSASSVNSVSEKDRANARFAAVHAGTRMEANMANIHMQVNAAVQSAQSKRNRRSLMKHYMPTASWSAPTRIKRPRRPNAVMQNPNSSGTTLGGNVSTPKPALTPLQITEPAVDYFSPIHSAPANCETMEVGKDGLISAASGPSVSTPSVSTPSVSTPSVSTPSAPALAPTPTAHLSATVSAPALLQQRPKPRTLSSNSYHGSMFGGVPGPHPAPLDSDRTSFYSSGPVTPLWGDMMEQPNIYQPQNVTQTKPSMRLPHTLRTNSRPRPKNNSTSSLPSGIPGSSSLLTPAPGPPSGVPSALPNLPADATPSGASSQQQLGSAFSVNSTYPALGPGYNNLGLGIESSLPDQRPPADLLSTPSSYSSTEANVPASPRAASAANSRIPLTLRQSGQKRFNEDKPWKGHKSQSDLTDRERKRYESLWMANRGTYLAYFAVPEPYQSAWEEAVQEYYDEKARRQHLSGSSTGSNPGSSHSNESATHPLEDPGEVARNARHSGTHLADKIGEEKAQRVRQVEQAERFSELSTKTSDEQREVEASELMDTLPELSSEPSADSVVSEVASEPAPEAAADDNESLPDPPGDAHSVHSVASATSMLTLDSDLENDDAVAEVAKRALDVHGFAVARLWRRSRLPEDTLEQIWDLVDTNRDGTLDRSGFVIGMWLCDQCLYGRKLPPKISPELWQSAGKLNLKIRVKPQKTKIGRLRKLPNILGKSMGYTLHGGRTAVKKAVQKATK